MNGRPLSFLRPELTALCVVFVLQGGDTMAEVNIKVENKLGVPVSHRSPVHLSYIHLSCIHLSCIHLSYTLILRTCPVHLSCALPAPMSTLELTCATSCHVRWPAGRPLTDWPFLCVQAAEQRLQLLQINRTGKVRPCSLPIPPVSNAFP